MPKTYQRSCALCGKLFTTLDRLARYCPSHTSIEEIFNGEKRLLAKCAKCGSTCSSIRKASTELDGVVGYCPRCQEWADAEKKKPSSTLICKICGKPYLESSGSVLICPVCDQLAKTPQPLKPLPSRKCVACNKDFLAASLFQAYCSACMPQIDSTKTIPSLNLDGEKTFLPGKSSSEGTFTTVEVTKAISKAKQICPVCNKNELKDDTKVCEPCRLELIKTPQKNNQKPKPKPGQRKVQYK